MLFPCNLPFLQFAPLLAERSAREPSGLRIFIKRVRGGNESARSRLPSNFSPEASRYIYESASERRTSGRDWRRDWRGINRNADGRELYLGDIKLIPGDVVEYGVVDG